MASKVIVVYGSTTGMTEMSANEVVEGLKTSGITDIVLKNVIDVSVRDFDDYEYILIGCSTWDYGLLQYDFEPFHNDMKEYDFTGKKIGIFGTGDKSYGDTYCLALKIIGDTIEERGGKIIIPSLDIESDLTEERLQMIRDWGENVGKIIQN